MSDLPPAETPKRFPRFLLAILLVALGFNLWSLSRHWHENLRDAYEFRQYQTALTALFFQKEGIKLAYETPVLGPPWSVPMEFPLYQAIVVKFSSVFSLPLEEAGRLTSILGFFGCFPAVWLLLRKRVPPVADRLVIFAVALLCPLFLFYSRTFLIESTALCASLWFLAAFDAALARPASGWLLAAWIVGGFASTAKVTTFVVIALPAIAITLELASQRHRMGISWSRALFRSVLVAALVASVPVIAGLGWVAYSDHLKELNPYGRVLTSTSLREFNFGTLHQRFTWGFWKEIGYHTFSHVITVPALLAMIAGFFWITPSYRRLALVCIGCYCGGFLIFANLYYVHDYYFYASAFPLLAALGLVLAGLLRHPRVKRMVSVTTLVVVLGSEVFAFATSYYSFYRRPNLPPPPIAQVIKLALEPDQVFAAFDLDWSSTIPYYAQRRAIMVFRSHTENETTFEQSRNNLKPNVVSAMIVSAPHRTSSTFLTHWLAKMDMEMQPIASTEEADLYVRSDLLLTAAAKLSGRSLPGVTWHLPTKIAGVYDLTEGGWPARLGMVSPAPYSSRGEYQLGIVTLDQAQVISAQAPTEILVKPPAGATHLHAQGGMIPGSYQNGNTTDGIVLEVREERPDGTVQVLFRRALNPLNNEKDRPEVVIDYTQKTPFQGTLVFGTYPGPAGNAAFDWTYWRSITVH